jgi:hypothetical protein
VSVETGSVITVIGNESEIASVTTIVGKKDVVKRSVARQSGVSAKGNV